MADHKDYEIIPFNRPFIVGKELYYMAQSVMAGHVSGDGPYTKLCQKWLEERLGCARALITHSCTAALEMSSLLCDVKPGDEIITTSFTFVSTASAFALRGAKPVFVDIDPKHLNIDYTLIEEAITDKTKVLVPMHYAGVPCHMDHIMEIARRRNLQVVEDAAHGFLSQYKSRYLGTWGHLGCFSFHETKNVISGEGGAIIINDEELVERAEMVWEKGTDRKRFFRGAVDKYTWQELGSSYPPADLTCAFLWGQIEHADQINTTRSAIFDQYWEGLCNLQENGLIQLPPSREECPSTGHLFYLIAGSARELDSLLNYLNERGICGVRHYVPLHMSPAGKKYCRSHGKLVNTEDLSARLLRLPLFYEITSSQVSRVIDEIQAFYRI